MVRRRKKNSLAAKMRMARSLISLFKKRSFRKRKHKRYRRKRRRGRGRRRKKHFAMKTICPKCLGS